MFGEMIVDLLEYACPAWGTCLPKYLSDNIEIVQKRGLRWNYPGQHYAEIIDKLQVLRLLERRETLCRASKKGIPLTPCITSRSKKCPMFISS